MRILLAILRKRFPPMNSRRDGVIGTVRIFLFIFICAILLAIVAPLTKTLPSAWANLILAVATSLGAFAVTVLFVRWDGIRLSDVGTAVSPGSLRRLVLGFLLGSILVALVAFVSWLVGHVRWVREPVQDFHSMLISLLTFIVLACREELSFRGYPLRRAQALLGIWAAQILIALVFSLEHVVGGWSWTQALLGAGVGSLAFGMATIATRGLAVPIGIHAAWNFGDWMLGGKEATGLWRIVVDNGFQERAKLARMMAYIVAMGLTTLSFWTWSRHSQTKS